MGRLVYGRNAAHLAAAVERGKPTTSRFGMLSAAIAAAETPLFYSDVREWLVDHAALRRPPVAQILWENLLAEGATGPLSICRRSASAAQALVATVRVLSAEGVGPEHLRSLSLRAGDIDSGDVMLHLAQTLQLAEDRCRSAGLLPRSWVLREPRELTEPPVGVVFDDPGRIAARTLMRGLREHSEARLGLFYDPDGEPAFAGTQRFLDSAAAEDYGIDTSALGDDEHLFYGLEHSSEAQNLRSVDGGRDTLELAAKALRHGHDVWSERYFSLLSPQVEGAARWEPRHPAALLHWAEEPLAQKSALSWQRQQPGLDLASERRLLTHGAVLPPNALPRPLATLWAEYPSGELSIDTFCQWLNFSVPVWARQAEALALTKTVREWATMLASVRQPVRTGERARVIAAPYLPSGTVHTVFLEPAIVQGLRSILPNNLLRLLRANRIVLPALRCCHVVPTRPADAAKQKIGVPPDFSRDESTSGLAIYVGKAPLPLPTTATAPGETSVSVSELVDYVHCAQRFYLRHKLRTSTPPGAFLSPRELGSALHKTLEQCLGPIVGRRLTSETAHQVVEAVPAALLAAVKQARPGAYLGPEDELRAAQWALRLQEFLRDDLRCLVENRGEIIALEKPVEWPVDGMLVRGRIDRLDLVAGGKWLRDYKMGRTLPGLTDPEAIQLYVYGEAMGWQVSLAGFHSLSTREWLGACEDARFSLVGIKRLSPRQALAPMKTTLTAAVAGILSGDFTPNPATPETCERCSVRLVCRSAPFLDAKLATSLAETSASDVT